MIQLGKKIENVILFLAELFHIKISLEMVDNFIQFIKFGIIGLSNTLIYYFTNLLTIWLVRPFYLKKDYIIGNIIGFVVSVLWSFYWNNKYVFQQKNEKQENLFVALSKVFAAYAFTGIILSNIISYVLIDIAGWSKYIVPLINSVIGVPVNFVLNKFWVFRNRMDESGEN